MSKPASLSSVVAKKGDAAPPPDAIGRAAPAAAVPEIEPKLETKEPRKEERKEVRRRPWDGQDDIVKANYEVPRRVQTKLHTLKTWGRVKNIKGFVSEALEAALDREIAKAEREGL
jgi:hypothetical protein